MTNQQNKGLNALDLARLSLFQGCLGFLAVIFAGLLNRIMKTELGFPALLVGGGLAFEQLVSPARVVFGNISDSWPIKGRRRTPYLLLGTFCFCFLAIVSIPIIFQTEKALTLGSWLPITGSALALCGLFALYGLAISMATTPYLALVIDLTTEEERPRAIGIIWCMLTVGIIAGAIIISLTIKGIDGVKDPEILRPALQEFMIRVSIIILLVATFSCWGIEPKQKSSDSVNEEDRYNISFGTAISMVLKDMKNAWALIRSSKQITIFFCFLSLYTLGVFCQDPILESYGGEIFGMTPARSTLLNAFWASGSLIGLLIAGLWVTPFMGKIATARLGCKMILCSFLLLMLAGLTGSENILFGVMVIFGLAVGIGTNSALSLMLDLTLPQVAGTFVGVWGLAQALSRAIGKILGGGLLDLGELFTGKESPLLAYWLVFSIEILLMFLAIIVLAKLSIKGFKKDTTTNLHTLQIADLD
ncbi:BCD family MFS transporter [Prochlorococcus sp. MIT 1300]|uniref:BCD family MFS transporter n=1 Tax=Prochlorococcus sp. MIT 1300 TaxID=3096218 RepID=UPI002A747E40|nr:BCD family MFS transporter [Prochlorococcus sp. MIT 1300]